MSATPHSAEPRNPDSQASVAANPNDYVAPPIDLTTHQLTIRALLSGALLGAVLSMCNIYTGLTIGWGLNMSVTSIILTYAFWQTCEALFGTRKWTILENNLAQTGCSSAAAVSSAGLVAPIPALAMMTGQTLDWPQLALWVFSVCIVGITVAVPLRRQMIIIDRLAFPGGMAAGVMLKEMYAKGSEAIVRVGAMLSAAVAACAMKIAEHLHFVTEWAPAGVAVRGFSIKSLTMAFDPTFLMMAVGGLIGIRGCTTLILGAIAAWLVIAPPLIESNYIRLRVSQPIPALPPGVAEQLKPEPEGFLKWMPEKQRLQFSGQMSLAERDGFKALSPDQRFQDVINKLYAQSQIKLATELRALPTGMLLRDPSKLEFDATAGMLRVKSGTSLTRADYAALIESSSDPDWRRAVDALYAHFQYGTTRDLLTIEKVPAIPGGFLVPTDIRPHLRVESGRRTVTAFGVLSAANRDKLHGKLNELARKAPDEKAACDELKAAISRLCEKSSHPLPEAATAVPPSLQGVVTIDPQKRQIRAVGVLSESDSKALCALHPDDADFAATISSLVAGSAFAAATPGFPDVVSWLLWPGVTLMVVSSLISFAFAWPSIARSFSGLLGSGGEEDAKSEPGELATKWFLLFGAFAFGLSVVIQIWLFGIPAWAAAIGVILSFLLALVAARVAGETNTTPVGAMGKVTQLVFGVLVPQNPAPNLMAANVSGGAASQCADLMHDLKTGHMLGASPSKQFCSQVCGALAGSLVGSAAYLVMIPHPTEMLMTEEWPAPAVATWKAVAELFAVGLHAIPAGCGVAIAIAALLGVILPILEKVLPSRARLWVPSPAALGLAFVIPATNSLSMFIGALIVWLVTMAFPNWSARFVVAICAGLVAGESLTGVGIAIQRIVSDLIR